MRRCLDKYLKYTLFSRGASETGFAVFALSLRSSETFAAQHLRVQLLAVTLLFFRGYPRGQQNLTLIKITMKIWDS